MKNAVKITVLIVAIMNVTACSESYYYSDGYFYPQAQSHSAPHVTTTSGYINNTPRHVHTKVVTHSTARVIPKQQVSRTVVRQQVSRPVVKQRSDEDSYVVVKKSASRTVAKRVPKKRVQLSSVLGR